MFQRFYPDKYITSAYLIEFGKLYYDGFRGVIFDIDNTLVEHGAPADKQSVALIGRLKEMGYEVMLLSNNKELRVRTFNEAVNVRYIHKANKPFIKNYLKAMKLMHTDSSTTIFVGDQLFTDVWGAKRAGIYTYLVQPIARQEEIQIVLKRYLERIVLHFYKKDCKRKHKVYLQGGAKDAKY